VSEATGPVEPTAKQRLQATRQALMHELVPSTRASAARQVGYGPRNGVDENHEVDHSSASESDSFEPVHSDGSRSGWFAIAKHSARAWWEMHPVRVVGAIAEPILAEYARHRPLKLVGIAAGIGAVIVVTRPWRLVSAGGLMIAVLKSSQVSNLALSLFNRNSGR